MQLDTTITLTRSELLELVRKAYPEIKSICEVKIIEEDVLEWLNKRTVDKSNDWIEVPEDWNEPCCPKTYPPDTKIDIMRRRGAVLSNVRFEIVKHHPLWEQKGSGNDFVQYRLSSNQF